MILDYGTRTVSLKIVFFGPAMSGKTTAIRSLFSLLNCGDRLTSIENTVGRTMFCDFGTMSFDIGGGWTIETHVWSATGQDFYRSTREVVLVGTDGIVFVADAQQTLLDENLASWEELLTLLEGESKSLPLVVCLNKQDLLNVIDEYTLRSHLHLPSDIPVFLSVAKEGLKILEAFKFVIQRVLRMGLLSPRMVSD